MDPYYRRRPGSGSGSVLKMLIRILIQVLKNRENCIFYSCGGGHRSGTGSLSGCGGCGGGCVSCRMVVVVVYPMESCIGSMNSYPDPNENYS